MIAEGREAGTAGIFRPTARSGGPDRRDRARDRLRTGSCSTPRASTSRCGSSAASAPTSTSATSPPSDVLSLETLRLGLRSDTLATGRAWLTAWGSKASCSRATARRTTTVEPLRVQGFSDTPLNDTGRRQAAELAERVAGEGIASLWSSDLSRARETARDRRRAHRLEPRARSPACGGQPRPLGGAPVRSTSSARSPSCYAAWRRAGEQFRFPGRRVAARAAGPRHRGPAGHPPRRAAAGAGRLPRRLDPRDALPSRSARASTPSTTSRSRTWPW